VSCDADKLFPSIIVPEALQILEKKMRYDFKLHTRTDLSRKELMDLVIHVTSDPYFACELGIFIQSEGAPMGGPLSGLLADLVLENLFEAKSAHIQYGLLLSTGSEKQMTHSLNGQNRLTYLKNSMLISTRYIQPSNGN